MTGVIIVLLATAVVLAGVVLYRFTKWRRGAARRSRTGGTVVRTARGPVEYASDGSGPAVLVLHGGLGGFDQGLAMGRDLGVHESFTLLAPSRAGYLRTPLETCRTPEETADALAALLDVQEIKDVAVIGISGGGHTALQFALRHPHRTRALVMLVALSRRYVPPKLTNRGVGRLLFTKGGCTGPASSHSLRALSKSLQVRPL